MDFAHARRLEVSRQLSDNLHHPLEGAFESRSDHFSSAGNDYRDRYLAQFSVRAIRKRQYRFQRRHSA